MHLQVFKLLKLYTSTNFKEGIFTDALIIRSLASRRWDIARAESVCHSYATKLMPEVNPAMLKSGDVLANLSVRCIRNCLCVSVLEFECKFWRHQHTHIHIEQFHTILCVFRSLLWKHLHTQRETEREHYTQNSLCVFSLCRHINTHAHIEHCT